MVSQAELVNLGFQFLLAEAVVRICGVDEEVANAAAIRAFDENKHLDISRSTATTMMGRAVELASGSVSSNTTVDEFGLNL